MANTYETQLANARRAQEKVQQRIARIEEALKTGKNPYYYNENDLRTANNELRWAKERITKLETKQAEELAKAASRNIPAILEFLAQWKQRVSDYYTKQFEAYYTELEAVRTLVAETHQAAYGTPEYTEKNEAAKTAQKAFNLKTTRKRIPDTYPPQYTHGCYYGLLQYVTDCDHEEALEKLDKELTRAANNKYDMIVERACAIVTQITDAAGLSVGMNGELNGIIIGTTGKCKIETIGAGGYNIQCYHFRVLVHRFKETTKTKEKPAVTAKAPEIAPKQRKQPTDQDTKWKAFTTEELENQAAERGVPFKRYNNPNIHRMRLIMALKKGES